jgi:asparagine synthase (glutamine-hydrolysing)
MCGIVGFNWEDKRLLKSMMASVSHRGPDQSGFYTDKNISLGHQRLSIIDLSAFGKQPIFNEDQSIAIVFNGEIYNHQDIRHELEELGHKFYTNTDTEAIVHAYEEYGAECLSRFNGMFAFAIYDSRDKSVFLARDRIGIKPLYYSFDKGKLIFASEIKALLEHDLNREVDKEALAQFFTFGYTVSPKTMFRNIYKLPPAHYLVLTKGKISVRRYWSLLFDKSHRSFTAWKHELSGRLKQSVNLQLMSEVPLGAYLSGGMDSSTIVAMMSKLMDKPVNTFSVGFDSEQVIDELKYARLVADKFDTNHHEIIVSNDDAIKALPTIAWHLDEPISNPASVPLYIMSKAAKKKMTVVLTGNGGDEVFAGYRQHKVLSYASRLRHIPFVASNATGCGLGLAAQLTGNPLRRYLRFAADFIPKLNDPASAYCTLMYKTFKIHDRQRMLGIDYYPEQSIAPFFAIRGNILDKLTSIDIMRLLPEDYLIVDDKINMANGIESRVPFLDHTLVEFGAKMPSDLKLCCGTGKYILRKAMKDILPKEVISRKKYGFTPPISSWIDKELMDYAQEVLLSSQNDYLNRDYITKVLTKTKDKRHYNKVFPLLMFGLWQKEFLEKE